MHDPQFFEIVRWITERSLAGAGEVEIMGGLCERLAGLGVPLLRAMVGLDTLHPLLGGRIFRWWRGEGASVSEFGREAYAATSSLWVQSPYYHLLAAGESLYRFRYPSPDGTYPFPVLADLVEHGVTDYIACVQPLGDAARIGELDCIFSSWSSDAPGGFAAADVARIEAVRPFLAAAITTAAVRQITRTIVETYLGRDAGERVLRGAIERGVTETIRAVLWFSDLKGFTSMVDSIDPALVMPLLNDHAEPQVTAIHAHGGTVLKFIGDGILAIFPVGDDTAEACGRALAAAEQAFAALAEVNARRAAAALPTTDAYLALHVGEVSYGNIGGQDRLDFTVIGPAVNEAARMSAMCRSLGQDIIVSQVFADAAPSSRARLVPLGSHTLRGVSRAQALFALPPRARRAGG